MQKIFKGLFLGFLAILALLFVFSSRVNAVSSTGFLKKDLVGDSRKLASAEAVTNRASKASEFKQTACEVHIRVINVRQKNIIAHAERVQSRLSKLTVAVEKYYTEKFLPQGKIAVNYDSLVANVSTKQAVLTAALDKIKTDTNGLTCEKDQAKAQFATFRTDMQSLLKTFKDYRLSVLQLMQAVKKAAGTKEGGEASKSAEIGE